MGYHHCQEQKTVSRISERFGICQRTACHCRNEACGRENQTSRNGLPVSGKGNPALVTELSHLLHGLRCCRLRTAAWSTGADGPGTAASGRHREASLLSRAPGPAGHPDGWQRQVCIPHPFSLQRGLRTPPRQDRPTPSTGPSFPPSPQRPATPPCNLRPHPASPGLSDSCSTSESSPPGGEGGLHRRSKEPRASSLRLTSMENTNTGRPGLGRGSRQIMPLKRSTS